ncbi:MAG: glucosaminidase domain-containing protein [Ectothiorhodospiraceae bacterium]|nr:glucosaminidase domain-containing protein [Ectothiorhodospiraceae bacterium]
MNQPAVRPLGLTDHRIVLRAATLALLLAGLWSGWSAIQQLEARNGVVLYTSVPLKELAVDSVLLANQRFEELNYSWPPEDGVPVVAVSRFPQDMEELSVDERKALFLRSLLPMLLAENSRLRQKNRTLRTWFEQGDLDPEGPRWERIKTLGEQYRLEGDPNDPEFRLALLRRVDAVPVDMALAQAAKESGWGTSRFTREANNLFGVWTWNEEQGLLPERRPEGATHFVRVFPDLESSVRNYVYTLNVGDAYSDLRRLREDRRAAGQPLLGLEMAEGLLRYSERGEAYVDEIRQMIRSNELDALQHVELRDGTSGNAD